MNARCLLVSILLLLPSGANAHAFAQRYDLPLPLWHYLVGAGATVTLSFVIAVFFLHNQESRIPTLRLALPAQTSVFVERPLRLLTVGAFVLLLMAGFFGDQGDWDSNLLRGEIFTPVDRLTSQPGISRQHAQRHLPTACRARLSPPGDNGFRRKPDGQTSALAQGGVVLGPNSSPGTAAWECDGGGRH